MFKNTYHTLVLISFLLVSFVSQAQVEKGVSVRLLSADYQGMISNDYQPLFSTENGAFPFEVTELGYYHGLTNAITLGIPVRIGNIKFPNSDTDVTDYTEQYFVNLGIQGIYKLNNGSILKKDAIFSPYFLAGLGATYLTKETAWTYDIPVGAGINLRLTDVINIQAQTEFHLSKANHLMHSLGFYFKINDDGIKTPPTPVLPLDPTPPATSPQDPPKTPTTPKTPPISIQLVDTDSDGISDAKDKCPNVKGLAKFDGCPDTDGDGVPDRDDKCALVAGLTNLDGCPDTDGDGIRDSEDKCPKISGLASNNGCPNPDTDGDGVPDSADKCPRTSGVASNNGCPEVKEETKKVLEFAKRGIKFQTGKNQLTAASYKILDDVAGIMKQNPSYSLRVSGYTDSQGKDATNLRLSKTRAKACYDYLVRKGISGARMTHDGYGEASPIADNGTKAGRALNRRVEFDIFFSGK